MKFCLSFATQIASGHFHSIILLENRSPEKPLGDWCLFTWGASPQSLKLKALLQKRKLAAAATLRKAVEKTPSPNERSDDLDIKESPTGLTSSSLNAGDHVTSLLTSASGDKVHVRPSEIDVSEICSSQDCTVEQIECGFQHSALVTSKGELWMWGKSMEHQLGLGDKKERIK